MSACKGDNATAEHFLLQCLALNSVRQPILGDIVQASQGLDIPLDTDNNGKLMQLLLDSTAVLPENYAVTNRADYNRLERQTRRLCHALYIERYKKLPPNCDKT